MAVKKRVWLAIAALLCAQVAVSTVFGQGRDDLATSLLERGGGGVLGFNDDSGLARFYSSGVSAASVEGGSVSAEAVAGQFVAEYGGLFGVGKGSGVTLARSTELAERSVLRYQQQYEGVPVIAGELVVQVAGDTVISANGELASPASVSTTTPALSAEQAASIAIDAVAKATSLDPSTLAVDAPALWLYNPALLGAGLDITTLVWRTEVRAADAPEVRQLVLVDAGRGGVALQFNQVDAALDLAVYDANGSTYLPGWNLVCTEGGCSGGATADARAALEYITDTYDYYLSRHGRRSFDGADSQIVATVRYGHNYQNAFWDGRQIVFGAGLVVDDVLAHELTHAVTQYESGLMYLHQSGAINEALSDFWGEMVDQDNGSGTDTSAVAWLLGEDYSGGAFRSMADPTAYGDPDSMTSPLYDCDDDMSDNGGVHSNSGVLNKAAYLLARTAGESASFNGVTVTAIGPEATAKIMYELQTHLLTSGSSYADVYYLLPQACTNVGYGSGVCSQVSNAVQATRMNQPPTHCAVTVADVCPGGGCSLIFSDDFERTNSGNWTRKTIIGSNMWYYPQNSHSYSSWDATYATSGVYNVWAEDPGSRVDTTFAMTKSYTVPAGATAYLYFRSAWLFEVYTSGLGNSFMADGGVVEYSTDGGSTWSDVANVGSMSGGYNGTIDQTYLDSRYDNPLAGRSAFVGNSYGYAGTRVDISSLAGKSVRFRFRLGTDQTIGTSYGWFIDDVQILSRGGIAATLTPTRTSTPKVTVVPTAHATSRVYVPVAAAGFRLAPTATATPVPVGTPDDPRYSEQWALSAVGARGAWNTTRGSGGPIVAVIDTGADLDHPDLAANLVAGYDFVNNDSSPDDDESDGGHGTHVSGIIGAVGNNGVGIVGINWTARIMPLKVLDADGSGWTSDIIEAIYYAVSHGAKVINMSLGGEGYESSFAAAITYAKDQGCLVVAAAGNEGDQGNPTNYPAAYDGVLAVAAVNSSSQRPSWSNYGSYVDISAPGVEVLSTIRGGYDSWSGTSMATPYVSGLAALIWAANPSLSRAQVATLITSTATDLGTSGRDNYYGYGLINAAAAVSSAASASLDALVEMQEEAVMASPSAMATGEYRAGTLLVQMEDWAGEAALTELSAQAVLAAQQLSPYAPGLMLVTVPEGRELEALEFLAQQPGVKSVGLDYAVHTM